MEPMIGEIRMFAGNFAPRSWAFCEGQLLAISSNQALFSILGTTYGGDGRTSFGLPDLRGRVAIAPGTGPGLPTYRLGARSGTPTTQLTQLNLPSHNHAAAVGIPVTSQDAVSDEPGGLLSTTNGALVYGGPADNPAPKYTGGDLPVTVGNNGGSQSFSIMQPYLPVYYIIALQGVFPSRN